MADKPQASSDANQLTPAAMTRADAARALGVSESMIRKLEREGTLEAHRSAGRVYLSAEAVRSLGDRRADAKLQRQAEAAEQRQAADDAATSAAWEAQRVELAMWESRLAKDQQERHELDQQQKIAAMVEELRSLKAATRHREQIDKLERVRFERVDGSRGSILDSELLPPLALFAALAFLARAGAKEGQSSAGVEMTVAYASNSEGRWLDDETLARLASSAADGSPPKR
jgi:hypothetical protein